MSKKRILLIALIAVVVASILFTLIKNSQPEKETKKTEREKFGLSKKTKTFIDPSGFKFSYPENLVLETKEKKGEKSYSELKILSEEIDGGVEVSAIETGDETIDEWLKKNKLKVDSKKTKKTKLGDLNASRFEIRSKLYTIALNQGILFSVITNRAENKDLWGVVHNEIEKSFVFTPPESPQNNNAGSSADDTSGEEVIFEGEEIIE